MTDMVWLRSAVMFLVVLGAVMQMQLSSAVPLAAAARVLLDDSVGVGGVGAGGKAGAGGVGVHAKAGGKPHKHKKAGGNRMGGAGPAPSAADCGDNSDPCLGGGSGNDYDYP